MDNLLIGHLFVCFFFNLALFIAWRLARNPRFSHRSVLSVHKGWKNIVQINQTSESKIFTTYYRPPHNPIYQLAFIPTFLTYLIFIGIARSIWELCNLKKELVWNPLKTSTKWFPPIFLHTFYFSLHIIFPNKHFPWFYAP